MEVTSRLLTAVRDLASARELQAVMDVVRFAARDLTGADGVTFVLRDGDRCHYAEENAIGPLWKGKRFPMTSCISGWAMLHKQTVAIEDIYQDSRIPHDAYRPTFVKSLAMVPVRREDPVAAIGAYWAVVHVPSPAELGLLENLADAASVALTNVRLYSELASRAREFEDLYRRAQAEMVRRQEAEDRLRHAQRMEALGRLAGTVAHDFNNVLTAITGFSDLILLDPAAGEAIRLHAAEIYSAARRGADLTRQLVAFGRRQAAKTESLDVAQVVDGMKGLLLRLLGRGVDLDVAVEAGLPTVSGDRTQVEQVLLNLVVNARDAMPSGGRIRVNVRAAGTGVLLEVVDGGVGMDESVRRRLFEPFFTTKAKGKGTGLGLAIVAEVVRDLGGTVEVESRPGRGSTFRVHLPRGEAASSPGTEAMPGPPAALGGRETVLMVEDEASIRLLVREALRSRGYTVLEAADGLAAEGIVGTHSGPIDLLLTDSVMPGLSGPELSRKLLRARPSMKVLFMSGHGAGELSDQAGWDVGGAYLPKPFTVEGLLRKVRETIEAVPGKA